MQLFDSSGSGVSTQHVASLALAALEFEPQATILPLNGLFEGTDLRVVAGGLAPAFRCCMLDVRGRSFQTIWTLPRTLSIQAPCTAPSGSLLDKFRNVPVQVVVRLP